MIINIIAINPNNDTRFQLPRSLAPLVRNANTTKQIIKIVFIYTTRSLNYSDISQEYIRTNAKYA